MPFAPAIATDFQVTLQRPQVDADAAWIGAAVAAQETQALGMAPQPLGIFARDADGRILGGINARRTGPDLYVQHLWVAADRRRGGLGRILMQAAEHAAGGRGCRRIHLNTVTFQAPGFYAGLGYGEVGRLVDFIAGNDRHYFRKSVEPQPLPAVPAGVRLEITDAPAAADIRTLDDGLTEHWRTAGPETQQVAALAHDRGGAAVGGVTGVVDGYAFTIVQAWVRDDTRGQGLGRRLVAALEGLARADGCRHGTVHAMDWQAPAFWSRLGYAPVLRIDDYLLGRGRTWMRKELRAVA